MKDRQVPAIKEPMLESFLRSQRIKQVLPYISRYPNCRLLDVGCGWEARLLQDLSPYITKGVGVDFKAPNIQTNKIQTFTGHIDGSLPFEDESFDLITMLAVLEHLDHPLEILKECARVLRPHGGLVITVPSRYAKPVLEFLAFRVGIVSRDEILDHKNYFNKEDLEALFTQVPNLDIQEHSYFQWKFNNRLFAVKR
jgi:2-polyprenyl-3-methyl-5-hydroxy-6-metoxy-1,4-benzoquinol methylase